MLGGMEEDPKVGDPPLAELAGLQFGLLSNEDTLAMSVFEKNQNIIGPKTLWDSRLEMIQQLKGEKYEYPS